jgi:hypothetical protein
LDCEKEQLYELGRLTQSDIKPSDKNYEAVLPFIDPEVMQKFSKDSFVYSRSGIHCDFHPRWQSDCSSFAIDSNHEGFRSIYIINLPEALSK